MTARASRTPSRRRCTARSSQPIFFCWYRSEGTLSIHSITTRRREGFYWAAVLATFALGTAAGDLTALQLNLGYFDSVLLFAAIIAIPAIGWWRFNMNPIVAFWFAYIVTRPLGASFADGFSKPPRGPRPRRRNRQRDHARRVRRARRVHDGEQARRPGRRARARPPPAPRAAARRAAAGGRLGGCSACDAVTIAAVARRPRRRRIDAAARSENRKAPPGRGFSLAGR